MKATLQGKHKIITIIVHYACMHACKLPTNYERIVLLHHIPIGPIRFGPVRLNKKHIEQYHSLPVEAATVY